MPSIVAAGLDIACRDDGSGPAVLLLHGWPDDATTWDAVSPRLNAAGFRTIAPMFRGFGQTRFVSDTAPRTGNTAILAMDIIAMVDALGIERFSVAGHDWGSAVGEALAVGWPGRVSRLCMLSSPPRAGGLKITSFAQAQRYWYHWFQATKPGQDAIRADPKGFAHIMWVNWAPAGWFDEALFAAVAASFDNPDWVDVTLHSYQARWGEAEPDPASRWLEDGVKATQRLAVPALFIQGGADGVNPAEASAQLAAKFSGPFQRVVLPGVGHFPTREAPERPCRHS